MTLACALVLSILAVGCTSDVVLVDPDLPPPEAPINHVVFFKLSEPADLGALIEDCDAMVRQIPGIVSYFRGAHIDTGRASVDHDFSLGMNVGFMDEQAYLTYVDHPAHTALVAKWGDRMESMLVRDVHDRRLSYSR
jgi:hypothetical protein